jgi:hypothetical protein
MEDLFKQGDFEEALKVGDGIIQHNPINFNLDS